MCLRLLPERVLGATDGGPSRVCLLLAVLQLIARRPDTSGPAVRSQSLYWLLRWNCNTLCLISTSTSDCDTALFDAGRVLTTNLRGGLRCPTCRQPHTFPDTPTVAAVPRNFALMSSLERLQQRGAAGGLLAPESLVIGDRLPGTARTAAVFAGVLNLHNRQVQVGLRSSLLQKHRHQDVSNILLCLNHVETCNIQTAVVLFVQVAVKKLPTAQVSSTALSEFKLKLQTLAFASSMCNRLCRLLGFIVVDGNLCLVMRRYQQSLQQLLASSEGKSSRRVCAYSKQL